MRKDAIFLALADIEGLAVSRVKQSVYVGFELARYVLRKRFDL